MRRLLVGVILSTLITAPALACGIGTNGTLAPHIPPLAAALDDALPKAKLADVELQTLKALRSDITKLAADHNNMQKAREVEEQAMKILGYRKIFLRCGPGIFIWEKFSPQTVKLTPNAS